MRILVPVKLVPDVVEELAVAADGKGLDRGETSFKLNEWDEAALEQALLIKEKSGAEVVVVAAETGDVDEVLFTALAKGADRALKLVGDGLEEGLSNRQYAEMLKPVVQELAPGLILTGVQGNDDLDGQLGPWLAGGLDYPYVTVTSDVWIEGGTARAKKEFPGGVAADLALELPAVATVQVAPKPPRYAPISRVRQMMKTGTIDEFPTEVPNLPRVRVLRMAEPVSEGHADMIEGDLSEKAVKILEILAGQGVLK